MEKIEKKIFVDLRQGWFCNPIGSEFINKKYYSILDFYVVHSIISSLTYKSSSLRERGWGKKVFIKHDLRNALFKKFKKEQIAIVKTGIEFRNKLNQLNMNKGFHKYNDEYIVLWQHYNLNQIESIFYHIRNSLAHGRFQIYKRNNGIVYCFESGIKNNAKEMLELKARIILKESTLLEWIEIIKNPILDVSK